MNGLADIFACRPFIERNWQGIDPSLLTPIE